MSSLAVHSIKRETGTGGSVVPGHNGGIPVVATASRFTAPVHIDVGGQIYTSSLDTLTRWNNFESSLFQLVRSHLSPVFIFSWSEGRFRRFYMVSAFYFILFGLWPTGLNSAFIWEQMLGLGMVGRGKDQVQWWVLFQNHIWQNIASDHMCPSKNRKLPCHQYFTLLPAPDIMPTYL